MKVSEHCKADPFLSRFTVDWGVCLHAHYSWVNILSSKVCVLQSDQADDFIACFCWLEDGSVKKRSFCITKVECLMSGQGVEPNTGQQLAVEENCLNHIHYFLEANTNDNRWFKNAQRNDKLRVRAPYHTDSPCFNNQFTSFFDIGQLDFVNMQDAKIEVHTPFIEIGFVDTEDSTDSEDTEEESPTCQKREIEPEVKDQMDRLSFFFEERLIASGVIWLPGFLYSWGSVLSPETSIHEEKGPLVRLAEMFMQLLITTIGLYNISLPFLPESYYNSMPQIRYTQAMVFIAIFTISLITKIHTKEVVDHFLKISIWSFLPDIALWKIITVMYNETRLTNFRIVIYIFFIAILAHSGYRLRLTLAENNKTANSCIWVAENRKQVGKKKKEKGKSAIRPVPDDPALSKPGTGEKKKAKPRKFPEEIFSIECGYGCKGVVNLGYLSLNCSHTCYNQFHSQCWTEYARLHQVKEEELLGQPCLAPACSGNIIEIVWVDKFGRETPRKFHLAETNQARVENKKKIKRKDKLTRSLSETSGSSTEDKGSLQFNRSSSLMDTQSQVGNSLTQEKHKVERTLPSTSIKLRNFTKSYASTVKSDKNEVERELNNTNLAMDSLHSPLVDQIVVGLSCPIKSDQSCKLPQKSKILTLIKENQTTPAHQLLNGTYGEIGHKDKPNNNIKSSVTFVPGSSKAVDKDTTKQNFVSSRQIEEKRGAARQSRTDLELSEVSPLTRIMAKQFDGFLLKEIDAAVQGILTDVNLENLTIPTFRKMLAAKLDESREVYMSDEEEECLICTEFLETDLTKLRPCNHVFHKPCIQKWLQKEISCPKCRAKVLL